MPLHIIPYTHTRQQIQTTYTCGVSANKLSPSVSSAHPTNNYNLSLSWHWTVGDTNMATDEVFISFVGWTLRAFISEDNDWIRAPTANVWLAQTWRFIALASYSPAENSHQLSIKTRSWFHLRCDEICGNTFILRAKGSVCQAVQ